MVDKKILPRLSRNMLESSFLDLLLFLLESLVLLVFVCCWFDDVEELVSAAADDVLPVVDGEAAVTVESGCIRFPRYDSFNRQAETIVRVILADETS